MTHVIKNAVTISECPADFCAKCFALAHDRIVEVENESVYVSTFGRTEITHETPSCGAGPYYLITGSVTMTKKAVINGHRWHPDHDINIQIEIEFNCQDKTKSFFITVANHSIKLKKYQTTAKIKLCEAEEDLFVLTGATANKWITAKLAEREAVIAECQKEIDAELSRRQVEAEKISEKKEAHNRYKVLVERLVKATGIEAHCCVSFLGDDLNLGVDYANLEVLVKKIETTNKLIGKLKAI
jgi:hypothetical protein